VLINLIFLIIFLTIFFLFFSFQISLARLKFLSLLSSGLILVLSCLLLIDFNSNDYYFQNILIYKVGFNFLNTYLLLGLDGISLFFFILSNFLIFLCILFIWNEKDFRNYALNLFFINIFLLLVFSVLDLLLFYIFFEAILIPMYLIIGIWGSRSRKIYAGYLFFFYTLVGSLFMLMGLMYIYRLVGTLNFEYLSNYQFTLTEQYWLWLAFFLSFATKIPMFPFHIWLPEAHVEAPTVGSVLLAGILLKLGVYGFIRFSLLLFPAASLYFSPLIYLLSILGILYASFSAIRQTDLKRIIAYSSVAHMNLVTLGVFSFNIISLEGSILQSISHGFVASGLFLLIGILYNRYHSRFLFYYSGLTHLMPLYSFFFFIFTLANIAVPGTSSFSGEFLLFCGLYQTNFFACMFAALGIIICGSYSLWLFNRLMYGNLKLTYTVQFIDLSFREFSIIFPLFLLILFMGISPSFFLQYIHMSVTNLYFNFIL
jgi:proton-translocating NADH-quinone oxidoreductase chain M